MSSARAPHTAAVEREGGSGLIRRMMATVVGFERPYSSLSGSVPVLANLGGKQHHLDIIFPLLPLVSLWIFHSNPFSRFSSRQ